MSHANSGGERWEKVNRDYVICLITPSRLRVHLRGRKVKFDREILLPVRARFMLRKAVATRGILCQCGAGEASEGLKLKRLVGLGL